jgi:hypothetical protein
MARDGGPTPAPGVVRSVLRKSLIECSVPQRLFLRYERLE